MFDPDGPVLGVDPGVSVCGYGAIVREDGRVRARRAGVIRTDRDLPLPERLVVLEDELAALVRELRPAAVAVERVLFQANVRTAISVGQASGLALAVSARAGIPVVQYSPNEVKLAVTGDGRADKRQVAEMVARILSLSAPPTPADAADALALALCHEWCQRTRAVDAAAPGRGFEGAVAAALARSGRAPVAEEAHP